MYMMYTDWMLLIKQLTTLKANFIENHVGGIEKDIKRVIFWVLFFRHIEIDYFLDSIDEIRPLFSKEVLLKKTGTNHKYTTYNGSILLIIIGRSGESAHTH